MNIRSGLPRRYAEGETRMEGLAELKVKESDRLAPPPRAWQATRGSQGRRGGADRSRGKGVRAVDRRHPPRTASPWLLTLALGADRPVTVDDSETIATSFPEFRGLMEQLGATYSVPEAVR